MYAVYNYKAGSTQAQVVSDIVLILTGTTNVASLSASCVQANTAITSSVAAGWSVYDAAAGTNMQVLRALDQGGSIFKYWGIQFSSTTAFICTVYESFNSGTHTGTNTCTTSNGAWDATNGGYFYIYATQKNIILLPWTTTNSYRGFLGSSIEFTRDVGIPTGYPCFIMNTLAAGSSTPFTALGGTNSWQTPRLKNPTTTGDTLTNATTSSLNVGPICNIGGPATSCGNGLYRDASENQYLALYNLGYTINGLFAGTSYDLKYSGLSSASLLDEFTYSGTNYVNFGNGNVSGAGGLWVPKQ
jgi:hypothetical protein